MDLLNRLWSDKMTVADLIAKLQEFDVDKQVKMELTDDYRDRCYDMTNDDIRFDEYEDAVVFNGSTLSLW